MEEGREGCGILIPLLRNWVSGAFLMINWYPFVDKPTCFINDTRRNKRTTLDWGIYTLYIYSYGHLLI